MRRDADSPTASAPGALRIGMRVWLTGAFAAVSLITAGAVYLFGDKPQALIAAVALGVLAGFLIAVAISHRVVRLARAAGEMAGGSFDAPLSVSGPEVFSSASKLPPAISSAARARPTTRWEIATAIRKPARTPIVTAAISAPGLSPKR